MSQRYLEILKDCGRGVVSTGVILNPRIRTEVSKMQMYSFSMTSEIPFIKLDVHFRPTRLVTNLEKEGESYFTGLYIGQDLENKDMSTVPNQFIGRVDAFMWSQIVATQVRESYLKEKGLLGKSYQEIDRYLDEHELSMPDTNRIDLPTVRKGEMIRITGEFKTPFLISFQGYGRSDESEPVSFSDRTQSILNRVRRR